jgi:hypothetical protein
MPSYNLYLDESGTANINDYRDTFFVICGIIIEKQYDHDLTSYFTFLKKRYGIQESVNFHAAEFFETRENSLFNNISDGKAEEFCFSLGEFIKTIPLKIIAHAVRKDIVRTLVKIPEKYSMTAKRVNIEDIDIAYEIIIRKMMFEFASHLVAKDALGAVIAESRRESDRILLQAYVESQEPFRFKEKPYYYEISDETRKRISSVCFENKRGLTGGLEIADICSYVIYRFLHESLDRAQSRGLTDLWEIIEPKIEKPIHNNNGLLLSKKDMGRVASDRINKISDRILWRSRSGTL